MLEILGTLVGGVLSGGATGLLGVVVQRWADYKNKQADLEKLKAQFTHEQVMRDKDAAIMAQEWAARTKVAEIEGETRKEVAAEGSFTASLGSEPKRYAEGVKFTRGQGWVMVALDAIRGLVRPALTVYLCGITTLIYWQAHEIMSEIGDLTPEQAVRLVTMITSTVLYLTVTCVLWWFGTRNKQQQPKAGI